MAKTVNFMLCIFYHNKKILMPGLHPKVFSLTWHKMQQGHQNFRSSLYGSNMQNLRNTVYTRALVLLKLSVQSLSCVWLFATPWTAARQASLPFTNFQSLLKLMSIESVMISNHLVPFSSFLQSFPALGSFLRSHFFVSGGQNIQDRFPLGWTGWISL